MGATKPAKKKKVPPEPRLWVRQDDYERKFKDPEAESRTAPWCRAVGKPIYVNSYSMESAELAAKGRSVKVKKLKVTGITVSKHWLDQNPDREGETDTSIKPYFEATMKKKDLILLHFTAGALEGSLGALTQSGYKVSTAFVLARDGTVYNLFDDNYWSYHLGPTAVGSQKWNAHRTVAIEIVNVGPLVMGDDDRLYLPGADGKPSRLCYCFKDDTDAYKEQDFRGYSYFATFTDAQYTSLNTLLKYIAARHAIKEDLLTGDARDTVMDVKDADKCQGLRTHINYRGPHKKVKQPDGTLVEKFDKWDIGPAFEWGKALQGIWPIEEPTPPKTPVEPFERSHVVARSTREASTVNTLDTVRPWPFSI